MTPVTLRGSGSFAERLAASLAPAVTVTAAGKPGTPLLVVSESADPAVLDDARNTVREGTFMLPVQAELGAVRIGPAEGLAGTGCARCLESRRDRVRPYRAEHRAVWARHGCHTGRGHSALMAAAAVDTTATMVADELARAASGDRARTVGGVVSVDLLDLTVRCRSFLPDPLCPTCGDLPRDAPHRVELVSRPKPAPEVHRIRRIDEELPRLARVYVDEAVGLVHSVNPAALGSLAVAGAPIRLRAADAFEPAFGRARCYRRSAAIALLEALERYGSILPGGRRTSVCGSYAELAEHALDPRSLGTPPPECYADPGYPYRPFTPDERCRWVWGFSLTEQKPVLVPEYTAYYGSHRRAGSRTDIPFCYELANGCALGGCVEEAIFHGILEVLERDAFLSAWYARLPVPRIDLDTAADRMLPVHAAAITVETGYTVTCFDTTMEHGVPSVWALACAGRDDPAVPKTVSAAGCGVTLEQAATGALEELGPMVTTVIEHFPDHAERARELEADGDRVATMLDHYLVYGVHEAADRLSFLPSNGTGIDLRERPEGQFRGTDLTADLRSLLAVLAAARLDVVVVDQTTPEHRAGGLSCVKVLIPGTVPMTFGHRNRRTCGLPRLLNAPALLGYRRPLSHAQLNPHPHPFP